MTEKKTQDTDTPICLKQYMWYQYARYQYYDTDTPDTTYSPSPGTMKGHILIKTIFSGPLNYVKQNGYPDIFTGWLWGEGHLGGHSCPPIFSFT